MLRAPFPRDVPSAPKTGFLCLFDQFRNRVSLFDELKNVSVSRLTVCEMYDFKCYIFDRIQIMENVQQLGREGEVEPRDEDAPGEALQLVKSEERLEQHAHEQHEQHQQHQQQYEHAAAEQAAAEARAHSPHHSSVITRRGVRTITAAGHITEEGEPTEDGVKDEPAEPAPDPPPAPPSSAPPLYAPKLEELPEHAHEYEERLRLADAEAARYIAFKQERAGGGRIGPRAPAPYPRGLALRYGAPHHVIVAQDPELTEHAHDVFLAHKDKGEGGQYAGEGGEGRQYTLSEQVTASTALEMIQTTALNQQSVGVAYQQVKYEARGENEARAAGTYASLQPVTSVHGGAGGGYYAGQSPQYASYQYGAPQGKELLTLYGGGGGEGGRGAGGAARDDSPPSQLLYRTDPTLSSSSLAPRTAHVVYGSVVPQSQAVYEAPPSPNSQQVTILPSFTDLIGAHARHSLHSPLGPQVTLYTHGNTVQYKVGGEHYLGQGGGVEYVPVSGYEGGLLVEGYPAPAQPWPGHNLLPIDDGFDPSE